MCPYYCMNAPHGCRQNTLIKKLDGNYIRMLHAVLNNSLKQHLTKQQLYGHFLLISPTIQVKQTGHTEHCWRSKDEPISDVLQLIPIYGHTSVSHPTKSDIHQFCVDTECSLKNLSRSMDDRNGCRERERERESQLTPFCQRDWMMITQWKRMILDIINEQCWNSISK